MRITIITIAALLLFALPAQAKEATYCQFLGIAKVLYTYLPQAAAIADLAGVDIGDVALFIENDMANFSTELRDIAMEKDSAAFDRWLSENGMAVLIGMINWDEAWHEVDRVCPVFMSIFLRDEDGVPAGFGVRFAVYLYQRGDIDELTFEAVVLALPDLRFTADEEEAMITWLAEEIAKAINLSRKDVT